MTLAEFIGPLSQEANTLNDQYEDYRELTHWMVGHKAVTDGILKAEAGDDDDGGDKPKKKKK